MLKFAVVTFALCGCASIRVHTDAAPGANLGQYRTFAWLPTDSGGPETIVDQHVRAALARELTQKGLREVPKDSADFLVAYHVLQEHKLGVADWGNGLYGWSPEVVTYSDGALIVDFIDPRTNRVIWRASASSAVEPPGVVDVKRLDRAASALARRYQVASAR